MASASLTAVVSYLPTVSDWCFSSWCGDASFAGRIGFIHLGVARIPRLTVSGNCLSSLVSHWCLTVIATSLSSMLRYFLASSDWSLASLCRETSPCKLQQIWALDRRLCAGYCAYTPLPGVVWHPLTCRGWSSLPGDKKHTFAGSE